MATDHPLPKTFNVFTVGEAYNKDNLWDFYQTTTLENSVGKYTLAQLIELDHETFVKFHTVFCDNKALMFEYLHANQRLIIADLTAFVESDLIMSNVLLHRQININKNDILLLKEAISKLRRGQLDDDLN